MHNSSNKQITVLLLLLLFTALSLKAQSGGSSPATATPQRPTFTANTSTTAPGTVELEFGTAFNGSFAALPTTIKFTPDVRSGLFKQMEWSLSFDSVTSIDSGGRRLNQFSDRLILVARRPVYQGKKFSLAVAPRASFFLRDNQGARLGITGLAAYAEGQNSAAFNFTWTAATQSSPSNPARRYDLAFDYARTVGTSGALSKLDIFAGVLSEHPSRQDAALSFGQGISYRLRPDLVLDFAVRELGAAAGPRDYQILTGFTFNLGRVQD